MNINENLELNTIAALAGKRDLSRVKQGDIIFGVGDLGDKLYSVVSGEVQLNWGDDGVETIGPGSSFGIGALWIQSIAGSALPWPFATVSYWR
jgi:CRP-like cAMP-binding protein